MSQQQAVLDFWLDEVGSDGWYVASDEVDDQIRTRFSSLVQDAISGKLDRWSGTPEGTLALLILLDQFSRNMHRGSAEAFACDEQARQVARAAIGKNVDLETAEPGRQFFYLPFEHSESLADQDWAVMFFETRTPSLPENALWHAKQHREVIRRFGRFPFRNAALGRESTPEEVEFLEGGGYSPGEKT